MDKAKAAALALGVALGGCATAPGEMSAEQRSAIRAVQVSSSVAIPDRPQVFASDASAGHFFLGPIGLMAAMASSEQPQKFKDFLAASGVDVREIVRDEFVRLARQAKRFPALVEQGGDAIVQIDIESYGLGPGFSLRPIDNPLSATLRVSVRIATAEGKLVWQKAEYITNMNAETESHKFDIWLTDRAVAERAFRQAAGIVATALLAEFNVEPPSSVQVGASGKPRPVTPLSGPDAERFARGHDSGGNVRFESEPGGDGRCSTYVACGNRDPREANRR